MVVSNKIQDYTKTKQAVQFLRKSNAWADIQKVSFFSLFYLFINFKFGGMIVFFAFVKCYMNKYLTRRGQTFESDLLNTI